MKKVILPLVIVSAMIGGNVSAQSSRAFAITSEAKGSVNWLNVQEINLSTGSVIKTVYNPSVNKSVMYDGNLSVLGTASTSVATESGVAAADYDSKTNRLYYTTMHGTDLR